MTSLSLSRELAEAATERLKVFAQPQRLMILSQLLEGELTVSEIEASTGVGQPALSQQLAELRRAGLVKASRAAKQVSYKLADDGVAFRIRSIEALFAGGAIPAALEALTVSTPQPQDSRPLAAASFATIG